MAIKSWVSAYVPWVRPSGYIDDQGRVRTADGWLENVPLGSSDFRRDFSRQPGWKNRNVDWWSGLGLGDGVVYEWDRLNGFWSLLRHPDLRYSVFAGEPVPDYDGPYFTPGAAEGVYEVARIVVPEWAIMRPGGQSHNDERIQYPGYGGDVPECYGGTWTFARRLRKVAYVENWRERVARARADRLKAKLAGRSL